MKKQSKLKQPEDEGKIEIWKPVVDWEDYYRVSNLGNVFDIRRNRILKSCNSLGYRVVSLNAGGYNKPARVHRLLAQAFIPNPENKPQINHKNGIKNDNRLENLEWCTQRENVKHAFRLGLEKPLKLSSDAVKDIFEMYHIQKINRNIIAAKYKIDKTYVNKLIRGEWWAHLELKDKYK